MGGWSLYYIANINHNGCINPIVATSDALELSLVKDDFTETIYPPPVSVWVDGSQDIFCARGHITHLSGQYYQWIQQP